MKVVPNSFFCQEDVVKIAQQMIGMTLFTKSGNEIVGGIITETEAYAGITDKASHAYGGRRTQRTEIMYHEGGTVYVYLCYGIHSLLNIVTNKKDIPHAVLIRAIEPIYGEQIMLQRLKKDKKKSKSFYGPGNVSKAFNVHYLQSGIKLKKNNSDFSIWIESKNIEINENQIVASKRIGIDYAQEDALLPWRFNLI